MKNWVIIVILAIILVLVIKFVGLNGLVVLILGDQGGTTRFSINNVNSFVNCWDADPANQIYVKSVCHAQVYDKDKSRLIGMNSVDYCKSRKEVVDFFCGSDLSCQELARECPKGEICRQGQCGREEGALKFPDLSTLRLFK